MTARQRSRRLLAAGSVAVSVVLVLLIARELRDVSPAVWFRGPRRAIDQFSDPLLNHTFPPGVDVDCEDATNVYDVDSRGCRFRTNAFGFKSDHAVTMPKPAGVFRVFVVGDSFVEGLCDGRFAMPGVLETRLKASPAYAGREVEVVNTGVSGFAGASYELLVRERVSKLAPDVVVIAVDLTDPFDDEVLSTVAEYAPDGTLLRLTSHGQARKYTDVAPDDMLGWARMDGQVPGDPTPWKSREAMIERTMGHVARAVRAAQGVGARVVLTTVPRLQSLGEWPATTVLSRRPMERVRRLAAETGARYFDTLGALEKVLAGGDAQRFFFRDDDHFNLEGNEAWGDAAARYFEQEAAWLLAPGCPDGGTDAGCPPPAQP